MFRLAAIAVGALSACAAGPSRAAAPLPALRSLAADGNTCWAAGDNGCVLRSDDRGLSWRRADANAPAHWQAIRCSPEGVTLFGGLPAAGHPAARALGAIARSANGGATWRLLPAPPGWLYGGAIVGDVGAVYGEAGPAAPGGVWRTITGGRRWQPAAVHSRGFAMAGAFRTPRLGWVVGPGLRTVSIRGPGEPAVRPPVPRAAGTFRAAAHADANTCWAVGDDGAVYRSPAIGGRPWEPLPRPLPAAARRLADFEAVAFAPGGRARAWVAGGLIGSVARSDDNGARWTLLPAPRGAAIHALAALDADTLLAAGDAGCIWRSADAGATWRLVRGREGIDVLFVAAAGDVSIYPAAAAHAMAGQAVAIVYATCVPPSSGVPADQPLRAAAAAAGACAAVTLTDFPSIAWDAAAAGLSDREILHRWSAEMDIPAEPEMVRQLAAAVRLYRPAVLAVGPDGRGPTGRRAENRLAARLARRAAELAAGDGQAELDTAGLRPHAVRRVFVGLEANERYVPPWADGPKIDPRERAAAFDAHRFIGGSALPLELVAARAAWLLPEADLMDRPAVHTAYARAGELPPAAAAPPLALFTPGPTDTRAAMSSGQGEARSLAGAAALRAAVARDQTPLAAADLTTTMDKTADANVAALAADRLLLATWRLMEEGKIVEADAALRDFALKGRPHPLARQAELTALAAGVSAEWEAQLRVRGRPRRLTRDALVRAAGALEQAPLWAQEADVRVLRAHVLAAAGDAPAAGKLLEGIVEGAAYGGDWLAFAVTEAGRGVPLDVPVPMRRRAIAESVSEAGRLDGALDEKAWREAPQLALEGAGRNVAARDANGLAVTRRPPLATMQAVCTAGRFVIFALRLSDAPGRSWSIDLAIDSDRDAWTYLLLHCDTLGQRRATLVFRNGPAAALDTRAFPLQGRKGDGAFTFEIAVPLAAVTPRPDEAALWGLQLRAVARGGETDVPLYYQPQPGGRLLPERFGLLAVPGRP